MQLSLNIGITGGITEVAGRKTYTDGGYVYVEPTSIATGNTTVFTAAVTLTKIVAIIMLATVNMTVTPYKGAAADTPIALKANVPYVWSTDTYDAILLSDDVTTLSVNNASGATGTFSMECLYNETV